MGTDDVGDREPTADSATRKRRSGSASDAPAGPPSFAGSRSPPTSRRALLDHARSYARTLDVDVDHDAIEWGISERAKRRAGACRFDGTTGVVTIRLTWRAYTEHGWDEMKRTIRHELVHAWEFQHFGEAGHGRRFHEKARELDAPRHCREFADARLRLVCLNEDCDWSADRHRAARTVTRPERRRCGSCGSEYEVRHVASGETWTTNAGYRAARDRIGEGW